MIRALLWLRTLRRVARARWDLRVFGLPVVHMVPLGEDVGWGHRDVVARPSLCGRYIDNPGNGTVQTGIVSCWACAREIERDLPRWQSRQVRRLVTEHGMTWCETCGHFLAYPPGCSCSDT
jgi:hypothetical protein